MYDDGNIYELAAKLVNKAKKHSIKIATAESCTGGLVAAAIASIPGASAVFECGFITYSDRAKHIMLGVPTRTINAHGACSAEVAEAMVRCAIDRSGADIAVSVTGEAGPAVSLATNIVGSVYIGRGSTDKILSTHYVYGGSRNNIRAESATQAVSALLEILLQYVQPSIL